MLKRLVGVGALFLAMVSLALAQVSDFDRYAADIGLLQRSDVATELELTVEQADKINALSQEFAARIEAETERLQGNPPESVVESVRRAVADAQQEFRGKVLDELDDEQIVRLRQLALQRAGDLSVLDDRVAAEIGLEEAKRAELEETYRDVQGRIESRQAEAFDPIIDEFEAKRPTDPEEVQAWRREFEAAINAKAQEIGPEIQAIASEYGQALQRNLDETHRAKLGELMGPRFQFRD